MSTGKSSKSILTNKSTVSTLSTSSSKSSSSTSSKQSTTSSSVANSSLSPTSSSVKNNESFGSPNTEYIGPPNPTNPPTTLLGGPSLPYGSPVPLPLSPPVPLYSYPSGPMDHPNMIMYPMSSPYSYPVGMHGGYPSGGIVPVSASSSSSSSFYGSPVVVSPPLPSSSSAHMVHPSLMYPPHSHPHHPYGNLPPMYYPSVPPYPPPPPPPHPLSGGSTIGGSSSGSTMVPSKDPSVSSSPPSPSTATVMIPNSLLLTGTEIDTVRNWYIQIVQYESQFKHSTPDSNSITTTSTTGNPETTTNKNKVTFPPIHAFIPHHYYTTFVMDLGIVALNIQDDLFEYSSLQEISDTNLRHLIIAYIYSTDTEYNDNPRTYQTLYQELFAVAQSFTWTVGTTVDETSNRLRTILQLMNPFIPRYNKAIPNVSSLMLNFFFDVLLPSVTFRDNIKTLLQTGKGLEAMNSKTNPFSSVLMVLLNMMKKGSLLADDEIRQRIFSGTTEEIPDKLKILYVSGNGTNTAVPLSSTTVPSSSSSLPTVSSVSSSLPTERFSEMKENRSLTIKTKDELTEQSGSGTDEQQQSSVGASTNVLLPSSQANDTSIATNASVSTVDTENILLPSNILSLGTSSLDLPSSSHGFGGLFSSSLLGGSTGIESNYDGAGTDIHLNATTTNDLLLPSMFDALDFGMGDIAGSSFNVTTTDQNTLGKEIKTVTSASLNTFSTTGNLVFGSALGLTSNTLVTDSLLTGTTDFTSAIHQSLFPSSSIREATVEPTISVVSAVPSSVESVFATKEDLIPKEEKEKPVPQPIVTIEIPPAETAKKASIEPKPVVDNGKPTDSKVESVRPITAPTTTKPTTPAIVSPPLPLPTAVPVTSTSAITASMLMDKEATTSALLAKIGLLPMVNTGNLPKSIDTSKIPIQTTFTNAIEERKYVQQMFGKLFSKPGSGTTTTTTATTTTTTTSTNPPVVTSNPAGSTKVSNITTVPKTNTVPPSTSTVVTDDSSTECTMCGQTGHSAANCAFDMDALSSLKSSNPTKGFEEFTMPAKFSKANALLAELHRSAKIIAKREKGNKDNDDDNEDDNEDHHENGDDDDIDEGVDDMPSLEMFRTLSTKVSEKPPSPVKAIVGPIVVKPTGGKKTTSNVAAVPATVGPIITVGSSTASTTKPDVVVPKGNTVNNKSSSIKTDTSTTSGNWNDNTTIDTAGMTLANGVPVFEYCTLCKYHNYPRKIYTSHTLETCSSMIVVPLLLRTKPRHYLSFQDNHCDYCLEENKHAVSCPALKVFRAIAGFHRTDKDKLFQKRLNCNYCINHGRSGIAYLHSTKQCIYNILDDRPYAQKLEDQDLSLKDFLPLSIKDRSIEVLATMTLCPNCLVHKRPALFHRFEECPYDNGGREIVCNFCGLPGHSDDDCSERQRLVQEHNTNASSSSSGNGKSNVKSTVTGNNNNKSNVTAILNRNKTTASSSSSSLSPPLVWGGNVQRDNFRGTSTVNTTLNTAVIDTIISDKNNFEVEQSNTFDVLYENELVTVAAPLKITVPPGGTKTTNNNKQPGGPPPKKK